MKTVDYMKSFLDCLGFISLVPNMRTTPLTQEELGRFPAFYPAVGFLFGLDLFILWHLTAPILPPRLAALIVTAFLIILNRGFHLDGLADAADALLSHKSLEQKHLILKDSRQGTFGVLAIVLNVLFKVELVTLVAPMAPWALILWPIWGRVAASVVAVKGKYVGGENGLGRWMVDNSGPRELFWALAFTFLASLFGGLAAILTALVAVACGFLLLPVWRWSLGGVTGDLLGATIELTEIVVFTIFFIIIQII